MAGERYADKAVALLLAHLESHLPTEIAAVESEKSATMVDPVDYVPADVPGDNRSPMCEVYETGWEWIDQRNSILAVDCMVAISFVSDCDVEAGALKLRQYETALLNTIRDNPTLTATVAQCALGAGTTAADRGDAALTRFTLEQPVEVTIHDS